MERLLLTRTVCIFFTVVPTLKLSRAVVMVIDSQDRERLPVARKELHSICSESSELAKDALLLVLVLLCSAVDSANAEGHGQYGEQTGEAIGDLQNR